MLTDAKIRAWIKDNKGTGRKLFDQGGMYLWARTNGRAYWCQQYEKPLTGTPSTKSFGVYDPKSPKHVSIAQARQNQVEFKKLIAAGVDPADAKRQAKTQSENSFEKVARECHEKHKDRWSDHHGDEVLKSLEREVFPHIGDKPIKEIPTPEILAVIRRIEARDALDLARRVLQRISRVFRYAIATGRLTYNPAAELAGAIKTRKVTHRPALSRADLPEFLQKLQSYGGHPITRLALHLSLLTFLRPQELRGARWEEFDFDRKEWRVPAARMKMKDDHIVPLSRQAIEVIEELRPLTGTCELLFPNENSPFRPISENTMLFAMYRMGYHSKATVHGFRATASTILNEMGFEPDWIERQLAHVERNKVRGAYHRSQYLEDRRRMMQAWGDYLDSLTTGTNVIPLRKERA